MTFQKGKDFPLKVNDQRDFIFICLVSYLKPWQDKYLVFAVAWELHYIGPQNSVPVSLRRCGKLRVVGKDTALGVLLAKEKRSN